MLDYLWNAGYNKTYNKFREEVSELHDFTPDPTSPTSGLLVKRWTSIIRMQRRIMELEKQLKQALEDLSNANPVASGSSSRAALTALVASEPNSINLDLSSRNKIVIYPNKNTKLTKSNTFLCVNF